MTGSTGNPTGSTGTAGPDVDFVALRPGQMIGRYEIVAVLGQGGFGITYRACDRQLGRDVAMKEYLPTALAVRQGGVTVLPRSTAVADDFAWGRQRFVDEGRTLASLQHAPAIVQVFDFLEANGTAYIVMRLLPGDTLESRLKKGPLSPTEADRILWPLLDVTATTLDLDRVGVCMSLAAFDSPDCATLPPRSAATPGTSDDAYDWGCQKRVPGMSADAVQFQVRAARPAEPLARHELR